MNSSSFEKRVDTNYLKVIAQEIEYSKIIIIDIETTGTYRFTDEITSFQIEYTEKETQKLKREFIEWSDFEVSLWTKFLIFLKKNKAKIVGHNFKFDTLFLYEKTGVLLKAFGDTLVMAHVLSEIKLGLKELVIKYFKDNYDIDTKNKTGEVTAKLIEYGLKDVMYTHKLYDMFKEDLKDNDLVNVYREELRVYNAYITVESQKGIYLDPNRDKVIEYLRSQYEPIKKRLDEVAKINWGSSKQIANILFSSIDTQIVSKPKKVTTWTIEETGEQFNTKIEATRHLKDQGLKPSQYIITKSVEEKYEILGYGLGLKPKRMTDSGNPSTDDTTLSELLDEHECIKDLREWKRLTKLETMIKGLEKFATEDGYIHPSFSITARTGRTTCKEPNLQNIPQDKNVRNIITAPKGYKLIEADFSQVELRVAAILSGDKKMLNAYKNGFDLHTNTMNLMFGNKVEGADKATLKRLRTYGKVANFGFLYGMTAKKFVDYASQFGLKLTIEEAEDFRSRYLNSYPTLVEWWEECKSFARTFGYSKTLTGRKRFLPNIWRHDFKERSEAERQSINSPVQGFASDLCICAMADIVENNELDHSRFRVIGTIHDAILLEVKEEYAEELGQKVKAIMEKPSLVKDIELPIPMIADVEIVDAWGG